MTPVLVKYADSRRTSVVESETSEDRPPITPASATGFSTSQITRSSSSSSRSTPSRVVSRSPGLGPADHDPGPGEPVEVERVQRLPELQHRVVGGVDDRGHRPHPRCREPGLRADRRRTLGRSAEDPRQVEGAALGRAELDGGHRVRSFLLLLEIGVRVRERQSEDRGRLARHPVDREEVRPVRFHLDIDEGVIETERALEVGARREVRGKDQDPGLVLLRDRELPRRAQHPVRHLPAERSRAQRLIEERDPGAGFRPRHQVARGHVADADDDLDGTVPRVHGGEAELVRVRVVADLSHGRHDDAVEPRPGTLDPLDLDPARVDPRRELLHVELDRDELPEPRQRDLHRLAPNWARNRMSPSTRSRMSGMRYFRRATRSMPRPKAKPV